MFRLDGKVALITGGKAYPTDCICMGPVLLVSAEQAQGASVSTLQLLSFAPAQGKSSFRHAKQAGRRVSIRQSRNSTNSLESQGKLLEFPPM